MAERPRTRTTVIVGWLTVGAMVIIAVISLLVSSPWNDKVPDGVVQHPVHHPSPQVSSSDSRGGT